MNKKVIKKQKLFFKDVDVELEKKNIKNVYISIDRESGMVRVSVPSKMKDKDVENFILSKINWIKKHQQKINTNKKENNYLAGEKHFFLGKSYFLEVVFGKDKGVEIASNKIILFVNKDSSKLEREAVLKAWYRKKLLNYVQKNRERWENIVGVCANEWRIKDMKTRWGSCNIKRKRIWISLQIIKKPVECIDYVMVHELAHFREKGHNKNFYQLLDFYYPGWRKVRKLLKKEIL